MGYVAVKGGEEAIRNSRKLYRLEQCRGDSPPLEIAQIREQLPLAVDRVMGEGGIYAPDFAALAFKQAAGDTFEAAFILRAYGATHPRVAYSLPQSTREMRVVRRISSSFKEIPGGQVLGATSDYTLRMLNFDLTEDGAEVNRAFARHAMRELLDLDVDPLPDTFPKVVDILRKENLLAERVGRFAEEGDVFDITREAIRFPASRSASLQSMARGETGGLLAIAYSAMRSFGIVHPNIGELRVGFLPLYVENPRRGEPDFLGEIKVTEAEVIMVEMDKREGKPKFQLGYGLCFGQNELKAISMALLDHTTQAERPRVPSEDQEFVLLHVDGVEAMGYGAHWKLPHYVTFQSELDRLRKSREKHETE